VEVIKPVGDLTPDDFRQHPVWSWLENDFDESLVTQVEATNPLSDEDYGVLFIYAALVLSDGTTLEGTVSINTSNRQIYLIEFFDVDSSFLFSGTRPPEDGTLEQLSIRLAKEIDDITPLTYITPYYLEDGTAIKGTIDLRDW
jgi:hypothetical protein